MFGLSHFYAFFLNILEKRENMFAIILGIFATIWLMVKCFLITVMIIFALVALVVGSGAIIAYIAGR
jgi:hypothetical protein